MLVELKSCFMEAYDDNQDGKIDIREVSGGASEEMGRRLMVIIYIQKFLVFFFFLFGLFRDIK